MSDRVIMTGSGAAPAGGGPFGVAGAGSIGPSAASVDRAPIANGSVVVQQTGSVATSDQARAQDQKPTAQQLADAAQELQKYVRDSGADLAFRVDQDSGRMVVSIIDRKDGTVLRQIPSEEALRISKALAKAMDSGSDASGGLVQTVA